MRLILFIAIVALPLMTLGQPFTFNDEAFLAKLLPYLKDDFRGSGNLTGNSILPYNKPALTWQARLGQFNEGSGTAKLSAQDTHAIYSLSTPVKIASVSLDIFAGNTFVSMVALSTRYGDTQNRIEVYAARNNGGAGTNRNVNVLKWETNTATFLATSDLTIVTNRLFTLAANDNGSTITVGIDGQRALSYTTSFLAATNAIGVRMFGSGASPNNSTFDNYTASLRPIAFDASFPLQDATYSFIGATADYQAFGLAMAAGGNFIVLAREGTNHVANDGKIVQWISTDLSSWSKTTVVNTAGLDDRGLGGGVTGAGTALFFSSIYDAAASTNVSIHAYRSVNAGANWTDIGVIGAETNQYNLPYGGLVVLPSGKLMQTFFSYNDGGDFHPYAMFSTDDGLTWGNRVTIHYTNASGTQPTETAACFVDGTSDGVAEIVAVGRNNNGELRQYDSSDGGATWTDQGALWFSVAGVGKNVSPFLIRNGNTVYLVYADRTSLVLRWTSAQASNIAGNPSAWRMPVVFRVAATSTIIDFGYPSVAAWNGKFRVAFNDGSPTPNMMISPIP